MKRRALELLLLLLPLPPPPPDQRHSDQIESSKTREHGSTYKPSRVTIECE
jgi:hypothetical protein